MSYLRLSRWVDREMKYRNNERTTLYVQSASTIVRLGDVMRELVWGRMI
jgi:hypothetical protein